VTDFDQLTTQSIKNLTPAQQVLLERRRLNFIFSSAKLTSLSIFVISLVISVSLYRTVDLTILVLFLFLITLVQLFRTLHSRAYFRATIPKEDLAKWKKVLNLNLWLSALLIGGLRLITPLDAASLIPNIIFWFSLLGIMSAATSSLSTFAFTARVYVLILSLAFIISCLFSSFENMTAMAIMVSMYYIMFYLIAGRQEQSFINSLVMGFENTELIKQLELKSEFQSSLNEILTISLMHISLKQQLKKTLLKIPHLCNNQTACIVLRGEKEEDITLISPHKLNEEESIIQNSVSYFTSKESDAIRQQKYYIHPIIADELTLGLLYLEVGENKKLTLLEEEFLIACSHAIASMIVRKRIEERLNELSYKDELTGVANRRLFMIQLNDMIKISSQHYRNFAVLFLDLDFFKAVNDNYGHEYGDLILIEATERMKACLRDTDIIARLGGDEFVIILDAITSADNATDIANKLIKSVSAPYQVKDKTLSIGASIGISLYSVHAQEAKELLKKADLALYQAKEQRGIAVLYTV
jgi:diguanylate cyclase (GGDEF)-like protein